jgi:hypothetical protein
MADPVRHSVSLEVGVVVTINDLDVIERITGPNGDEWRAQMYKIYTADEVIEHLARGHVMTGAERANQLDGWADCADDAATMGIEGIEAGEVITEKANDAA